MLLTDLLHPDCIQVPLVCKNKQDAIFQLIDVLASKHHLTDAQQLKDAVWERENTRTTGMGFNIAIPHGKTSSCNKLIMGIGIPDQPLEFNSVDGQPVKLILLLISPADQTKEHIQVLSAVSRMLVVEDIREAFFRTKEPSEVYDLLQKHQPKD
jgi:fructose-specific phosphotransferase system IIA component